MRNLVSFLVSTVAMLTDSFTVIFWCVMLLAYIHRNFIFSIIKSEINEAIKRNVR